MMGFMAVTGFLSMFVSNTGACAMICPIVEAMVAELYQDVILLYQSISAITFEIGCRLNRLLT